MAHGNSSRFPRRTGSRRKVTWGVGPTQRAPQQLTAAGASLWALGSQITLPDLTLVRVRGEFTAFIESATSIGDGYYELAFGICIVTENAFNAGVASVPAPLTDLGWDGWLFHRLVSQMRAPSTTELFTSPMEAVRIEIDSKVMRKEKATDVMIGVTELGTEAGACTLTYQAVTRVLDKLP